MEPFCDLILAIMFALEQVPVINDIEGSKGKQEQRKSNQETIVQ